MLCKEKEVAIRIYTHKVKKGMIGTLISIVVFICGMVLGGIIGFVLCGVVLAGKVMDDWERLVRSNAK